MRSRQMIRGRIFAWRKLLSVGQKGLRRLEELDIVCGDKVRSAAKGTVETVLSHNQDNSKERDKEMQEKRGKERGRCL